MLVTLTGRLYVIRSFSGVNEVIEVTDIKPQLINRNICFTELQLNQWDYIILKLSF